MLTKCVNCRFYVRQAADVCLNCGTQEPSLPYEKSELLNNNVFLFFLFLTPVLILTTVFYLLIYVSGFPISDLGNIIGLGVIAGIITSIVSYRHIANQQRKKVFERRKVNQGSSLIYREKVIKKRIEDLIKRENGIDLVIDRIDRKSSKQLQAARVKLLEAREIVTSQIARYELQKNKIDLVRLQNSVLPYLDGMHRLDEFQIENGIVESEMVTEEINRIRHNLTSYDAIDFPKETLPDKEGFLDQLKETENSCEQLREVLLTRQAARTLRDIQPVEESLKLPPAKDLARQIETFNIEVTLIDFSESFDELEREYKRLKADDEISQQFLTE